MSYKLHQRQSESESARCAVVTLSDTRNESTDTSGARVRELIAGAGHAVVDYRLLPDGPAPLAGALGELLGRDDLDVVITTGGTGISRRDAAIGAVEAALDVTIPGFGELFRMLSYREIGSGAFLSRAVAGVGRGKLIFALPGSTPAVELAMKELILPELKHLIHELRK